MKRWLAGLVFLCILWTAAASADVRLGTTEELVLPEQRAHAAYALEDGGFLLLVRPMGCVRMDRNANILWQVSLSGEDASARLAEGEGASCALLVTPVLLSPI